MQEIGGQGLMMLPVFTILSEEKAAVGRTVREAACSSVVSLLLLTVITGRSEVWGAFWYQLRDPTAP